MINSYKKGWRGEHEFRKLCEKHNLEIVWQKEDPNKPDTRIERVLDCEIKYRSAGIPKRLYQWLGEKGSHMLAVKRISPQEKGRAWLIIMPAKTLLPILKEYFGK